MAFGAQLLFGLQPVVHVAPVGAALAFKNLIGALGDLIAVENLAVAGGIADANTVPILTIRIDQAFVAWAVPVRLRFGGTHLALLDGLVSGLAFIITFS